MKKIISLLLLTLLLVSCGKTEEIVKTEKKDFLVEISPIDALWNNSFLKKSGKIEWKDDIKLSSQANWRISKIAVKEWEKVKAGQNIVFLDDTVANYDLNLEKVDNLIEKIQISYDSTKISLDKQVYDIEIALEKLRNNLETLKNTSSIDIIQTEDNLSNLDYTQTDTKSSIELDKLENTIAKLELDYDNTKKSNIENISWFKETIKKEIKTQSIFINDLYIFWDKLFNISGNYDDSGDKIKDFLWAKNTSQKNETIEALYDIRDYKNNTLDNLVIDVIDEANLAIYIKNVEIWYTKISDYLDSLEKTLLNSVSSEWSLSQTSIDLYTSSINSYQTLYSTYNASFLIFKNSSTSFLNTYKNTESSIEKQIELLNKDKNLLVKNYDLWATQTKNTLDKVMYATNDNIKSLELQIKQTEQSLDTMIKTRDITLKWIENSLKEAYISEKIAIKEYNKLNIKATIDWVIWDILVNEWQDINNGTPILTIISDKASQVELYFKESELASIEVWNNVFTNIWDKSLTWSIYSISTIADNTLSYKVLAVFNERIQNLWWVIDVSIPIKSSSILIPIKNIKLVWTNKWIVYIYNNKKVTEKEILLWKMYKDDIEFLGFLDSKIDPKKVFIVTSDFSNFDENKHIIKIEQ